MGYAEQFAASQDAAFRGKVQVAVIKAAADVFTEAAATPLHAERVALAKAVLLEPASFVNRMALGAVVANPALTAASTDAQILAAVGLVWNYYAGVS